MNDTNNKAVYTLLLAAAAALWLPGGMAAGFYLSEIGTPTSIGTGGVANPTNTHHADAAWTNPAGMTGLDQDSMVAGLQTVSVKLSVGGKPGTQHGQVLGQIRRAAGTAPTPNTTSLPTSR